MGRKQTSTATADIDVSTIIHTCQSREDINPIMRQAIMIAGDLNATSIKEAIAKASSTGSLSNHTSSVESLSSITGDKWVSILRLGMEAACYDANKQNSFEQQCKTWRNMDLSQLSTYIQIMACELFNFDACVGIFGGQFCTDYERFKVLKGALEQHHLAVSDELEDIIVESIDTDTLSMEWEDISELIRKAFTRATRRKPIRPEKDDEPLQTHHSRMKPCPSTPTPDAPELDILNYEDKTIKCIRTLPDRSTCNKQFTHSAAKQVEHARLGYENDPKA